MKIKSTFFSAILARKLQPPEKQKPTNGIFFNYNNEETFFRIAQKNKSSKIKGQND